MSLPEVVYVQPILHPWLAVGNAEEVPLRVPIGAAVWGQPQLIFLT